MRASARGRLHVERVQRVCVEADVARKRSRKARALARPAWPASPAPPPERSARARPRAPNGGQRPALTGAARFRKGGATRVVNCDADWGAQSADAGVRAETRAWVDRRRPKPIGSNRGNETAFARDVVAAMTRFAIWFASTAIAMDAPASESYIALPRYAANAFADDHVRDSDAYAEMDSPREDDSAPLLDDTDDDAARAAGTDDATDPDARPRSDLPALALTRLVSTPGALARALYERTIDTVTDDGCPAPFTPLAEGPAVDGRAPTARPPAIEALRPTSRPPAIEALRPTSRPPAIDTLRPTSRPPARTSSYFPPPLVASEPPPKLVYDAAREAMRDGDLVFFRGRHVLSRVVRTLTRGEYSHCGIVSHFGERKVLLHADVRSGVTVSALSTLVESYEGELHWYSLRPDARSELDLDAVLAEARAHLHRTFAWSEIVLAAAAAWLGAPVPRMPDRPPSYFCSQYVSRCFRKGGLTLTDVPDNMASPSLLAASAHLDARGKLDRGSKDLE
jgi:hypothetical protein